MDMDKPITDILKRADGTLSTFGYMVVTGEALKLLQQMPEHLRVLTMPSPTPSSRS